MISRIFFAILLFILGPQAWAQSAQSMPPVFPAQIGSAGSAFKAGQVPDGKWLAWSHTIGGETRYYAVCARHDYVIVHPDTTGMTPIRTARAYWAANVMLDCKTDPTLRPMWLAAMQAMRE